MAVTVGIVPVGSGWILREEYPLVRSRCNYSVADVYVVAEIVQDYHSNAPVDRDVEYVFPLPPSGAVCSFKAVINDTQVIRGVVKEKHEAKKAYYQAVAEGKTAGLLQQEHADVFCVSLGNIKPRAKISVHISFVSIVPHDGSSPQTLRITMPTAIAPRYGLAPTNFPWFGNNAQNRFELSVSVQMNGPITSISSPSHPIGLTLGCHQRELTGDYEPSKAFVYLSTPTMLDRDVVILISAQGLDTPRCSVERWLKSEGAKETTDAYALTLVPKFELPALPSQEYIFLVDRSGSMAGGRITAVKAALQILLRSLPSYNTSFNIISFGSHCTPLWSTSQPYTAGSMEQASQHIDGFHANYEGTELRSALEFAFRSREGLKSGGKKGPTSIFVLTDGEAWDLDGVIQIVERNCERVKNRDGELRTFILGVGNQVSTAMCEGIAQAGKGVAVFVAEGESPDAKLMSLLKAGRGSVIEDLTVDWAGSEGNRDEGGELEDIKLPKADYSRESSATSPPPQSEPPLDLFNESHVELPSRIGAQKSIDFLDPPPKVQQAPKSDKLPVPLYPGFRCSIFAIVKRCANPGPPSSSVKITGKVMGRDVVLQIPVSSTSVHSVLVEGKVEGGKLLHTLAAKALIQSFEDLPKTLENNAQIERLGKQYSLASSVTSFVATDEDTERELKGDGVRRDQELSGARGGGSQGLNRRYGSNDIDFLCESEPISVSLQVGLDEDELLAELCELETEMHEQMEVGVGQGAGITCPVNVAGVADDEEAQIRELMASLNMGSQNMRPASGAINVAGATEEAMTDTIDGAHSITHHSITHHQFHTSGSPPALPAQTTTTSILQYIPTLDSVCSFFSSPASNLPSSRPTRVLSIESIARTQNFDGSFPSDDDHFRFIVDAKHLSMARELPLSLKQLGGEGSNAKDTTKKLIWTTILTSVCLQKRFGAEKDSWEMLVEKARGFIEKELIDFGLEVPLVAKTVKELECAASNLF